MTFLKIREDFEQPGNYKVFIDDVDVSNKIESLKLTITAGCQTKLTVTYNNVTVDDTTLYGGDLIKSTNP